MLYYTIYKITNKINGKYYIGKHQTYDLSDDYMGSGKYIKRAIKKYGLENFSKEILFVYDNEDDMNKKENELVIISEETYNICEGGKGGFSYLNKNGLNKSDKQKKVARELMLELHKTVNYSDEYKESRLERLKLATKKMRELYPNGTWIGKKHKEDSKIKIGIKNSINQQGEKNSQFGTCWITNGKENKKIKKEDFEKYQSLGFYKGRVQG